MRLSRVSLAMLVSVTVASTLSGAQQPPAAKPFDLIGWNGGQFIYGVDYYPEAWSESLWEKDAAMMQAAGINFVRMGEFAWVKMEPSEGHYDFAWLDGALKVLNAHGIKAVLGTPSAAPPAWLMAKYPDIGAMNEEGVRYRFGSRRNYCLHNPNYLAAIRGIVTALAEHYKNHPGVLGWQIDNELGSPDCYDNYCLAAFQKWCRTKYSSLDTLNKAWGTVFWGHTYTVWSQIPLPWDSLYGVHNPSLELDYRRFFSDSSREFLVAQTQILRHISPTKAITHNEMGMFDTIDYSSLNTALDFVAWDNYPLIRSDFANYFGPALAHDLMRGSKDQQNFMIMEQQGGLPGWNTFWGPQAPPPLYRVWAYQAIAHGADGVCYFRWRTSRYGTEQYWQGVLDQDSYPNARYQTVKQTGQELKQLTDLLHGTHPVAQAAMLVSPDTRWAFHIQTLVKNFDYNKQLHAYYNALRRQGLNVDVVFPQGDFSLYKVLVAPSLFVVTPALTAKLTDFVQGGGTLILTYRSGVKDEHNVFTDQTLPGPLAKLAGVVIRDYDPQIDQTQEIVESEGTHDPAAVWFDILSPTTAETLATYGKKYYAGSSAVAVNTFGKGRVYYVGTEPSSLEFYDRFTARVLHEAGLERGPQLPDGVEMATRSASGRKIVFLLNYTEKKQSVDLGQACRDALTGATGLTTADLPPYGVEVLVAQ
ncbi:MAG TPA: beta-galactosidase [Terriglobia bacterium]|nr:beta-galactosidase [Terriglobia bacterium]